MFQDVRAEDRVEPGQVVAHHVNYRMPEHRVDVGADHLTVEQVRSRVRIFAVHWFTRTDLQHPSRLLGAGELAYLLVGAPTWKEQGMRGESTNHHLHLIGRFPA